MSYKRGIVITAALVGLVLAVGWYLRPTEAVPATEEGLIMAQTVQKSDEEWRSQLTAEQYRVTRQKGTERAFTGAYWDSKADGVYTCVCCGQPLFDSQTKFDSGTGWPSFWQPDDESHVARHSDRSWLMMRTEVVCSRCGAHLGHVFSDGPPPTHLRYCINSASLQFAPRDAGAK